MMKQDPAESETAARRKVAFATTFDQLVAANLELVKTVRAGIFIITTVCVVSMVWAAYGTYTMKSTLLELHTTQQIILEFVAKSHP